MSCFREEKVIDSVVSKIVHEARDQEPESVHGSQKSGRRRKLNDAVDGVRDVNGVGKSMVRIRVVSSLYRSEETSEQFSGDVVGEQISLWGIEENVAQEEKVFGMRERKDV